MRPKHLIAASLLALVVLLGGPALAQTGSAPITPEARVQDIVLQGFDHLEHSQVLDAMETKSPRFLSLTPPPPFNPQALERDVRRLEEMYRENGFFDATVSQKVKSIPQEGAVKIILTAVEGPATVVKEVLLQFDNADLRRRWEGDLAKLLPINPGDRFSLSAYEQAKKDIALSMANQGHPLNQVRGQVRVWPHELRAQVVLRLDPGPPLSFGETTVSGNQKVAAPYILRETAYLPAQPFTQEALRETERRLLSTGLFTSVSAEPQFDQRKAGRVPVVIKVYERSRHGLRLGLGYGTEDQFRVRLTQINRNLLGLTDTLTFEGKISSIYRGLEGRWEIPKIFTRETTFWFGGGLEQEEAEAFTNARLYANPVLLMRLKPEWTWYVGYNVELNEVQDLKSLVDDPEFEKDRFFVSSLKLGITFDNRDSPLDPKRGTYFRLETEFSHEILGSELNIFRPVAEFRQILPLSEQWRLAGRLKGGFTQGLGGTDRIPLIRRFFLGGADSVRGFPYQRLGPLDINGDPLGGVIALEGGVELRYPIWGDLGGVLFVDGGNTWDSLEAELPDFYYTTGAGLRYQTPVGPLRLDFGWQINPPEGDPYDRWQIYLSVGQAF